MLGPRSFSISFTTAAVLILWMTSARADDNSTLSTTTPIPSPTYDTYADTTTYTMVPSTQSVDAAQPSYAAPATEPATDDGDGDRRDWSRRVTNAHSYASHKVSHYHHKHIAQHKSTHTSTYHGRGTWYMTGQGACGETSGDSEHVVAISHTQYIHPGETKTSCFRMVRITNLENGKIAPARIVDMCPGCSHGSLDMSQGLFEALSADGGLSEGVLSIKWEFDD